MLRQMGALSEQELGLVDAYWRAANYLSVAQIYLLDNPLLREPLQAEHVKPRLLGHFGTVPGLNLLYAHLNRQIRDRDLSAIYVTGPGLHLTVLPIGPHPRDAALDRDCERLWAEFLEANHRHFSFRELDLSEGVPADDVTGAEWVFHLAAMAGLTRSWLDFDSYARHNLTATHRLLEALKETDADPEGSTS